MDARKAKMFCREFALSMRRQLISKRGNLRLHGGDLCRIVLPDDLKSGRACRSREV